MKFHSLAIQSDYFFTKNNYIKSVSMPKWSLRNNIPDRQEKKRYPVQIVEIKHVKQSKTKRFPNIMCPPSLQKM